ncbi:MAG TPA: cytidylate kinase-like family protein [candidate division Zixibacteria bacterium]|nr:cytidylate kinase-like family protein [candidate division Zixibacteria bacterium]HEQ99736.1 cytidylate kinase-like family protein [candidate division Zixibacteria bacterium]
MPSIEQIVDRQIRKWELLKEKRENGEVERQLPPPIITVSRMRGSRGSYLAQRLAEELGYQLMHKEIIEHIVNSSGIRRRLIESLDEKYRNQVELWLEGIFKGRYSDASDYFRHLYRAIITLSRLGGVVVVGRGSNFILTIQTGFHLRVVASSAIREKNLMKYENLSQEGARQQIADFDKERQDFIKRNFKRDINDPEYYDMILSTNYIDIEDAVAFIKEAIEAKFTKQKYLAE